MKKINKIAIASAEVEGGFYGKYTRVEETAGVAKGSVQRRSASQPVWA